MEVYCMERFWILIMAVTTYFIVILPMNKLVEQAKKGKNKLSGCHCLAPNNYLASSLSDYFIILIFHIYYSLVNTYYRYKYA